MGAAGSKEDLLRREEVAELEEMSGFDGEQVLDLYKRFRKLDRAGTGTITRDDLLKIPELSMNPLVDRVLVKFGFLESARINFADFLRILAPFNPAQEDGGEAVEEERVRLLFQALAGRDQELLTEEEAFAVLKSLVGPHMEEDEIREVVRELLRELGGEGGARYADFRRALSGSGISETLSVRSWRQDHN